MSTDPRHLHWDACLNVRDLGGFPTRSGHTTRSHAIIRADNLCRLTAHGRGALMRYGVRTAIDLREPGEHAIEHDPFSRPELGEVDRVDIPLLTRAFRRGWPSGLDGHETKRFGEILREIIARRGTGILLVEHDMSLVMEVCDYIYVIDFGQPIFEGTPAEVRHSEIVRAAYLGSDAVEEVVA